MLQELINSLDTRGVMAIQVLLGKRCIELLEDRKNMAIYKNREVQVTGLTPSSTSEPQVSVKYPDGTNETVKQSHVAFTQSEKDSLVKRYPSQFDDVSVATDDDVAAVRIGATPPSDPVIKEQAKVKVQHQKQLEETSKRNKEAEDKANQELQKEQPQSATVSQPDPTDFHNVSLPNQAKAQ